VDQVLEQCVVKQNIEDGRESVYNDEEDEAVGVGGARAGSAPGAVGERPGTGAQPADGRQQCDPAGES
jgi:hypothetical protein